MKPTNNNKGNNKSKSNFSKKHDNSKPKSSLSNGDVRTKTKTNNVDKNDNKENKEDNNKFNSKVDNKNGSNNHSYKNTRVNNKNINSNNNNNNNNKNKDKVTTITNKKSVDDNKDNISNNKSVKKENEEIEIELPTTPKGAHYARAETLYKKKCEYYIEDFEKNATRDDMWKEKIKSSGTSKDRISAITLLIQKAPMYRLSYLDQLLHLAAKKSERDRELAVEALKDLFINSLLPNSKLKKLTERFGQMDKATNDEIIQWYFEDLLKSRYQAFIGLLEKLSKNSQARVRMISAATIQYLLLKKPEQEEVLLQLLINKIGDEDGSNSEKVIKLLNKLLEAHPGMTIVAIKEIESFLHRPNNLPKAQYKALYFLNSLQVFIDNDRNTTTTEKLQYAHKLIQIYFSFFQVLTKKKPVNQNQESSGDSSLSLILFGIKKAYEISKDTFKLEPELIKDLFKVAKNSTINKTIKTLCLIYEVAQHHTDINNEYFKTLFMTLSRYERLSQFDQTSFLNLIFKSVKGDSNTSRGKAILKRLLQFSMFQNPSFAMQCLILLSELVSLNAQFGTLIQNAVNLSSDEIESKGYNPYYHDPSGANADNSNMWELNFYQDHYHPNISTSTQSLFNEEKVDNKGNPAAMFTLHGFLEKFVLRRAKKVDAGQQFHIPKQSVKSKYLDGKDSDDDDEEEEEIVQPDEKYLSTFNKMAGTGDKKKKSKKDDLEFVDDDDEIDRVLGFKAEDAGNQDSDDEEDDFSGSEYSYEDLKDEDFEDDDLEQSEKPKKLANAKSKKSSKATQEEDDDDNNEEDDLNEDDLQDDEDLEDEDGDDTQYPDFGDEEVDPEDDDEEVMPEDEDDEDMNDLLGDDLDDLDDDDDDDDDEMSKKFKKQMKSDGFMDADDFAKMLETSGKDGYSTGKDKSDFKKSKSNKSSFKKPTQNKRKRSTK
ncbi:CAATT-binding protein [Tieghemostelium lacteum]|uniref:CAATT-binding protein n=1 Tax=Tieghemostelium lacteum TaxID=361077 RepID=A0A151ZA55_TIELA|nr:CAATT-binding protein [Tieghemostelium lacteum]|eukprot:KYQ90831.1 CAATT-binding protein [Tieghemostelium lacteum]